MKIFTNVILYFLMEIFFIGGVASQKTSENHAFRKQIRQETCINEIKYLSFTAGSLFLFIKLKLVSFGHLWVYVFNKIF